MAKKRRNFWKDIDISIKENDQKLVHSRITQPQDFLKSVNAAAKKIWGMDIEELAAEVGKRFEEERKKIKQKPWWW